MPRPDPRLVAIPGGAARPRRARDPRIDAFRGVALAMIFIDHIPGNPYENFTLRNWGFSDAAEAFFVMSGIAAGIAYSGRFLPEARARDGLWPAVAPVWKRAWVLYLVHLFLTLAVIAIFAAGAEIFSMSDLLKKHNLGPLFADPQEVLFGLPLLGHQIGYVNILPVYSILLLFAPAAILLGLWRPWLLAVLSAAAWFAAGLWRVNMPNFPRPGEWFFNPLSWQAVFVTGLLIGIFLRRGERLVPVSRVLFGLSLGWVVTVLAWKYVPGLGPVLNHQMWKLGELGAPFHVVTHNKAYLALPRLLHVLAVVYLVSCLPVVTRLCAHRVAAPLRMMGRQGLLVFAAGTVMALSCQTVLFGLPDSAWPGWVLPPLGLVVLVGIAWLGDWRRRATPRPAPARPRPQAVPVAAGQAGA